MTVAVVGCMRTGTSLAANILSRSGVWLGEQRDLDWRGKRDPEGIWENLSFVQHNDTIIKTFGGHWVEPNSLEQFETINWDEQDLFVLNRKGRRIMQHLDEGQFVYRKDLWGWKDPRNSLTLGYWHKLMLPEDDFKVIWCVRHPTESSHSMQSIGYDNIKWRRTFWDVWHRYNQSLLQYLTKHPNIPVLYVHFPDWFNVPDDTYARILDFLGLSPNEKDKEKALSVIKGDLYRMKGHEYEQSALYETIAEKGGFEPLISNGRI